MPTPSPSSSHSRRRLWLAFAVTALLAVGGIWFVRSRRPASVPPATPRVVRAFTLGDSYASAPRYTGTVRARTESDLGFRVRGKILEKLADAGQRVAAGQPLLRLDPADLQLASEAARQAVDAARAERDRALPDLQRQEALLRLKVISKQEYDRALAAAEASTARLRLLEAQARQAANELDYAVLTADAAGVVIDVPADAGQVIAAGQVVVRLARDGAREAVIDLPESALGAAGSATEAHLYTEPDRKYPVELRELSAMADPITRTYRARYTLAESGQSAPLGATVIVSFQSAAQGANFEVPLGALYDGGRGPSLWLIDLEHSTVSLAPVRITHLGQESAAVRGDLPAGARVVALGAHLLKPTEKVRVALETTLTQAK